MGNGQCYMGNCCQCLHLKRERGGGILSRGDASKTENEAEKKKMAKSKRSVKSQAKIPFSVM